MKSDISVVIPLYNKGPYVLRAIDSVLRQDVPPLELIVVDDGSTDDSASKVQSYCDDHIILLRQPNAGVSVARNRGILHANGNYVCLLDADDEWMDGHLSEMTRLTRQFPNAALFSVASEIVDETGNSYRRSTGIKPGHFGIVHRFIKKYRTNYGLINSSAACINKRLFDEGLSFPAGERLGEDIFFWLQASTLGAFAYSDCVLTRVYRNADNRSDTTAVSAIPYFIRWSLDHPTQQHRQIKGFAFRNAAVLVASWALNDQIGSARRMIRLFADQKRAFRYFLILLTIFPKRTLRLVRDLRRKQS